jgi:hypothetical protein
MAVVIPPGASSDLGIANPPAAAMAAGGGSHR